MPTILQTILRKLCILILSIFCTCIAILKTLSDWWNYNGATAYFSVKKRSKPKVLDAWKHGFLNLKVI